MLIDIIVLLNALILDSFFGAGHGRVGESDDYYGTCSDVLYVSCTVPMQIKSYCSDFEPFYRPIQLETNFGINDSKF